MVALTPLIPFVARCRGCHRCRLLPVGQAVGPRAALRLCGVPPLLNHCPPSLPHSLPHSCLRCRAIDGMITAAVLEDDEEYKDVRPAPSLSLA